MTTLRLGPLGEDKPVKLTIELPGALHCQLSDYAALHAAQHRLDRPLPLERLVVAMTEHFIASDRGFPRGRPRNRPE
jgi:hypothetical protein